MKTHHRLILSITALLALGFIAAPAAHADSRQKNKNFWRNAAIASGAVAAYGLTHHKDTLTIAGAAGAAYSAQRYEDDRHSQSLHNNGRHWYRGHDRDRGEWEHHDRGHHYGWYKHHGRGHRHHDDDDD